MHTSCGLYAAIRMPMRKCGASDLLPATLPAGVPGGAPTCMSSAGFRFGGRHGQGSTPGPLDSLFDDLQKRMLGGLVLPLMASL